MEASVQLHALTALPQGKSPKYLLDRRLDGPRGGLDMAVKRRNPFSALARSQMQLSNQ